MTSSSPISILLFACTQPQPSAQSKKLTIPGEQERPPIIIRLQLKDKQTEITIRDPGLAIILYARRRRSVVSVVSIGHDEFRRDDRFSSFHYSFESAEIRNSRKKKRNPPPPQPISFHIHHQVDIIRHVDDVHTRAIVNKKL